MYYLRIENGGFGFVVEGIHDIKDTDIAITEEDYQKFFELQSQAKQFKLKSKVTGIGLFDYIEECSPAPIEPPKNNKDELKEYKEVILSLQELIITQQMTILELQNK